MTTPEKQHTPASFLDACHGSSLASGLRGDNELNRRAALARQYKLEINLLLNELSKVRDDEFCFTLILAGVNVLQQRRLALCDPNVPLTEFENNLKTEDV